MESLHGRAFTALFAANDQTAGACLALYRKGICVSEDVSIIGFDDLLGSRYMTPPITIRQPAFEMGEETARLILGLIENKAGPGHLLPFKLVLRDSVVQR